MTPRNEPSTTARLGLNRLQLGCTSTTSGANATSPNHSDNEGYRSARPTIESGGAGEITTPVYGGVAATQYAGTMRLWLKDSERRPDPEPVKTDDRKAMLVGLVLWLLALVVLLLFLGPLVTAGLTGLLWTCVVGLALGFLGLIVTHRRHS